jgi:hypothetical protein
MVLQQRKEWNNWRGAQLSERDCSDRQLRSDQILKKSSMFHYATPPRVGQLSETQCFATCNCRTAQCNCRLRPPGSALTCLSTVDTITPYATNHRHLCHHDDDATCPVPASILTRQSCEMCGFNRVLIFVLVLVRPLFMVSNIMCPQY